ncbi:hypothetical protein C7M61_000375 [Candidozyma pseudohaemuli]|uniref:Uncharacterized protein n=1 Tax=Candidozyma pseudohaemuli TaxID=418784 RepID=A0A2P7YXM8_9ASCO|nr:hypothetical protein C7M61_000375 [[Candida] pseudohaemulonii]PSK40725.1 hypothetical protein C7M61_000375 [[Candida] pseudohaemulonii]
MLHSFRGCGLRWSTSTQTKFVRYNSSILGSLVKGEAVSAKDLRSFLASKTLGDDEVEKIHEIVKNEKTSVGTINQLLQHGLQKDFSLYYTVNKASPSHVWDNEALHSLIKHNPGRAISLWALLEKLGVSADSKCILEVVNKLLEGEISELKEGAVEVTPERLDRAIKLLNLVREPVEQQWELLVQRAIELKKMEQLSTIEADAFVHWLNQKLLSVTDQREFLHISKVIFDNNPELLSKDSIAQILSYAQNESDPVTGTDYLQAVIDLVELKHLDTDKKDPESLLIRLKLVTTYGIHQDDFNKALEKFHAYQTHEKFGIELVQAKLVQVFGYQAFKRGDKTLLRIAETLVDPDELQVKTLAQLILARSKFNCEDSLNLYNDYINQVSKDINETTGRSPTGVLTEALMTANLYNNDREFAHLLYDKAIASGFLKDEAEAALIKKVFKVYGDSFEESDSWEEAQPRLANFVLDLIRRD